MKSASGAGHSTIATATWDPHFAARSPMFEPLRRVAAGLAQAQWPSLADLQQQLAAQPEAVRGGGGALLRFVAQGPRPRRVEDHYEVRIYATGEVQVRESNWHDLLNALVWLTFPRAKAALNARHYQALRDRETGGALNRGPVRDALTLFDEGGVIVAATEAELLRRIERFEWKELFWQERAQVVAGMRFYLFGHALYEKALAPFTGITGRAILLHVAPDILTSPLPAQLDALDRMVAAQLRDPGRLHVTRDLAPLPILGVPGWCVQNGNAAYYDDAEYFRRGRRDC